MNLNKEQIKSIFDKIDSIEKVVNKKPVNMKLLEDTITDLRQTIAAIYIKSITGDE